MQILNVLGDMAQQAKGFQLVYIYLALTFAAVLSDQNETSLSNTTVQVCNVFQRMCKDGICDSIYNGCSNHGGAKCQIDEKFCPGVGCVYKSLYEPRGCHYGTCLVCNGGSCSSDGTCPGIKCPKGEKLCNNYVCDYEAYEAQHCKNENGCYENDHKCESVCNCLDCSDENCSTNVLEVIGNNMHIVIPCLGLALIIGILFAISEWKKTRQSVGKCYTVESAGSASNGQTQQLLPPLSSCSLNPLHRSPKAEPRIWEANPDHLFHASACTGQREVTGHVSLDTGLPPPPTYGTVVSDSSSLLLPVENHEAFVTSPV